MGVRTSLLKRTKPVLVTGFVRLVQRWRHDLARCQPQTDRDDAARRGPGDEIKVIDTPLPRRLLQSRQRRRTERPVDPPPSRLRMRNTSWSPRSRHDQGQPLTNVPVWQWSALRCPLVLRLPFSAAGGGRRRPTPAIPPKQDENSCWIPIRRTACGVGDGGQW